MAADSRPTPDRRQTLFLVLSGVFLTNALLAEMIGGKLFQVDVGLFDATLSCGVLLWPVVFVISDVINEYFGRRGVRRLSILGAVMIAYAFIALFAAGLVPAAGFSPVQGGAFDAVFLQSRWIIAGSIAAFLAAQLIDVSVFWMLRRRTGPAALWLRATGSTVVSQLVDTLVVGFIGLHVPHLLDPANGVPFDTFLHAAGSSYAFKFLVAVGATPVLYLVHAAIDRYLGPDASRLTEEAARR